LAKAAPWHKIEEQIRPIPVEESAIEDAWRRDGQGLKRQPSPEITLDAIRMVPVKEGSKEFGHKFRV
jgi:hypothetical protein